MKEYQRASKVSGDIELAMFFIENREKWMNEPNRKKVLLEKLEHIGQVAKLERFSEITILSMILADKGDQEFDTDETK